MLISDDDNAALQETAYLLRSPKDARRLLTAYTDALEGRDLVHHDFSDLEAVAGRS